MEQIPRKKNPQQIPSRKQQKYRRKKQQRQRLIVLLCLTFFLGFFSGVFVGIKNSQAINFIMAPASAPPSKEQAPDKNLPWNLKLVNAGNPLPEDFAPEKLAEVDNGYSADSRIEEATKKMIADAREEDVRIIVLSAFRDYEYQTDLYNKKVQKLQSEKGYSVKKAREEAATVVASPGTSEHQLGLALDLVDARHVKLDESQEQTKAYQWLKEHCDEYGFIVRYPNNKTELTGVIYEPWHFRYVGEEAAREIMDNGLCLEEYLKDYYKQGN